jgi:hypothetical protein
MLDELRTNTDTQDEKLQEIIQVCQAVCRGDFQVRVTNLPEEGGQIKDLCLAINELIDRADAYVRESTACLGISPTTNISAELPSTGCWAPMAKQRAGSMRPPMAFNEK